MFSAQGYDGTSMRDLAERVGITTAALYYHFDSKADILQEVVRPLLEGGERMLEEAEEQRPADVDAVLASTLDLLLEHRAVMSLLARDVSSAREPGIGDALGAMNKRLVKLLVGSRPSEADRVRVIAALGALRRPILDLPDVELALHRDLLLSSARCVLAGQQPTPAGRGRSGRRTT